MTGSRLVPGIGALPAGARAERISRSPRYRDGVFVNPESEIAAAAVFARRTMRDFLFGGAGRRPAGMVPLATPAAAVAGSPSVVWYGHASALVELDGRRVLIDPMWSERCSPVARIGPRRLHPVPVALRDLPRVDAVLISHDHYDHLDMATVRALKSTQDAPFLVPLGVGAHLERWGVPEDRIVELDWAESAEIAGLRLTATPAYHFSGRTLNRNRTLWSSWVIAGPSHRIFYSGDSGYFEGYAEIGREHGPFDAALIQVGAYDQGWATIHMYPEQAVAAHLDLRGGLLVPVHWATFNLALHTWSEPVERLWREAKAQDVRLAVPRPGERITLAAPPAVEAWWQAVA